MDIDSILARLNSLEFNNNQLENRVRYLEKLIDTKNSSWYKRIWWRIDGWPPWYKVGERSWRPWHKGIK